MGRKFSQNRDLSIRDPLVRAYHEAGHVVADRRVGHEIDSVSIKVEKGVVKGSLCSAGTRPANLLEKCFEDGHVDQGDVQELLELLVPYWAGPAAQKKFRPASVHRRHAEDDREQIHRCVEVLCFSDARHFSVPRWRERMTSRIKRRAAALMNDPAIWAQVEAVAAALVEKTELSGAQVDAILQAAGPDPE
jgi:hypothetical protein